MSEWFKEPVLKTGDSSRAVGSNPTLSATFFRAYKFICLQKLIAMQKYPSGYKGLPC